MSDIAICPHIIWKVDMSHLNSSSRSYCRSINIFKSHWKMVIVIDKEWEQIRVYAMPEVPEDYQNVRFSVKCGVRDTFGTLKFERYQTLTTECLLSSCIWAAGRTVLSNENLIQSNLLWIICTIEPDSKWEDCQKLDSTRAAASSGTTAPCMENLLSDVKQLLLDPPLYDVILLCENKEIKAHRSILSCRSDMFEGMFRTATKEAIEGRVIIKNTSLLIFEKIVHYIYTTEINFESIDFACNVYIEADKFLIKSLKERCIHFIKTNLSLPFPVSDVGNKVSDACKVLCLASKHADINFKDWVKNYLADKQFLVTWEWSVFTQRYPDLAIEVYYKLLYNSINW